MNGYDYSKTSSHPSFVQKVCRCITNLFSELVARTLFGDFFRSFRDPHRYGIHNWDREAPIKADARCYDVHNVAMIGNNTFLRSTGKNSQDPNFRVPFLVALLFTLSMGLLTLPFAILRTTVKLILLVPKLCILRAEDYFCKYRFSTKKVLLSLARKIVYQEIYYLIKHQREPGGNDNLPIKGPFLDLQKFANANHFPKHLFGPGHFIYMALYHSTFAATLASIPLLLHEFDKLPHVAILYSSLGLLALFSVAFLILNAKQCLQINIIINALVIGIMEIDHNYDQENKDYEEFHSQALKIIQDSRQLRIKKLIEAIDEAEKRDEGQDVKKLTKQLCNELTQQMDYTYVIRQFSHITERALLVPLLRDKLHYGDNYALPITGNNSDIGGLPIMDMYDGTTDLGFGVDAILTAPIARIFRVVRISNPLSAPEKDK